MGRWALQCRASYETRKGRCSTLPCCKFLSLNRLRFKETCSSDRVRSSGRSHCRSMNGVTIELPQRLREMFELLRIARDIDGGDPVLFDLKGGCLQDLTVFDGDETG